MYRRMFKNRYVIIAYITGAITIILAIYLLLYPYTTKYYYNGIAPINVSLNLNPSDIIIIFLNSTGNTLSVNLTLSEIIPQTNITVYQYYNVTLSPNQNKTLSFIDLKYVDIKSNGNGYIIVMGLHRSLLSNILTIITIILFILTILLLLIGFIELISKQ